MKLTTAAGRVLYNHVSVSVGFMSSSDKRVHFGLGSENQIRTCRDPLAFRWNSAAVRNYCRSAFASGRAPAARREVGEQT